MPYQDLIGDKYKYDPNYHKTAEFFGLNQFDREDFNLVKKMSFIYDWGGKISGDDQVQQVLTEIYKLKKELGVQSTGKILINELYQYLKLESPIKQVKDAVKKTINKITKPKEEVKITISNKKIVDEKKVIPPEPEKKSDAAQNVIKQMLHSTIERSLKDVIKNTISNKKNISESINKTVNDSLQKMVSTAFTTSKIDEKTIGKMLQEALT